MVDTDFPFSSKRCREGAQLCLENTNRLLDDACILFHNKRYITASILAIYSLEEIGKSIELLKLSKNGKDLSKSKWNKLTQWGAHKRKIRNGRKLALKDLEERLQMPGKVTANKFEQAHSILSSHYNEMKKQYLYVGLEDNKWTSPTILGESQLIMASMDLGHSFEGYMKLAKELGRNDRCHEAFRI